MLKPIEDELLENIALAKADPGHAHAIARKIAHLTHKARKVATKAQASRLKAKLLQAALKPKANGQAEPAASQSTKKPAAGAGSIALEQLSDLETEMKADIATAKKLRATYPKRSAKLAHKAALLAKQLTQKIKAKKAIVGPSPELTWALAQAGGWHGDFPPSRDFKGSPSAPRPVKETPHDAINGVQHDWMPMDSAAKAAAGPAPAPAAPAVAAPAVAAPAVAAPSGGGEATTTVHAPGPATATVDTPSETTTVNAPGAATTTVAGGKTVVSTPGQTTVVTGSVGKTTVVTPKGTTTVTHGADAVVPEAPTPVAAAPGSGAAKVATAQDAVAQADEQRVAKAKQAADKAAAHAQAVKDAALKTPQAPIAAPPPQPQAAVPQSVPAVPPKPQADRADSLFKGIPSPEEIQQHIDLAASAINKVDAAKKSGIVAKMKAARRETPRAELEAMQKKAKAADLHHQVAKQKQAVHKLAAELMLRKQITKAHQEAYTRAMRVFSDKQKTQEALYSRVKNTVQAAVDQASGKLAAGLETKVGGLEEEVAKLAASEASKIKSKEMRTAEAKAAAAKAEAAAAQDALRRKATEGLLDQAKMTARVLIEHAKKEDQVATAAAALSHTNTAALQSITNVAHSALDDIRTLGPKGKAESAVKASPLDKLEDAKLDTKVDTDEAALAKDLDLQPVERWGQEHH